MGRREHPGYNPSMSAVDWIVVANASRVRVYVRGTPGQVPRIVDEIDFPRGRARIAQATDEERDDQRTRWAGAIARHLDACFLDGKFAWLTLVMEKELLTRVRAGLNDETRARVARDVAVDIAALPPSEAKQRLLALCAQ